MADDRIQRISNISKTDNSTPELTPTSFMNGLKSNLKSDFMEREIIISGIFVQSESGNYKGRGYFYDRIFEEGTGQSVSVKVPEFIHREIEPGDWVKFRCWCWGRVDKDGRISPCLDVSEYLNKTEKKLTFNDILKYEVLVEKSKKGNKDVKSIITKNARARKNTSILLVCGNSAIVDKDVMTALGASAKYYSIEIQRITLSSENDIEDMAIGVHTSGSKYDLVAIIRGGGDLQLFNIPWVSKWIVGIDQALLVALGHASDRTLTDEVADQSFTTPTALGIFLRDTVNEELHLMDSEARQKSEAVDSELRRKRKQNYLLLASIITGLLIGTIFGMKIYPYIFAVIQK